MKLETTPVTDPADAAPRPSPVRPSPTLVLAGAGFAAALAVAGCLLVRDLRESTVRDTERGLRELSTLLAEQTERALSTIEVVEAAVADDLLPPGDRDGGGFAARAATLGMHERLAGSASALPQVSAITIVDARGRPLNSSRGWPVADAAAAAEGWTDGLSIRRRAGGAPEVVVARRVARPDGSVLGSVLGTVDLRYFDAVYAEVSQSDADVISMVGEGSVLLARHPSPPGAVGRTVPPIPGLRPSPGAPAGSGVGRMTTPIDGQDRIIATRALARHPLVVGTSRTVAATLAAWRRQATALAVGVALLVGGLALVLRSVAGRIEGQRRLARLEAAAEARAAADRRIKDEYARVGRALDGIGKGLCLSDAAGRVVFVNAPFAGFFGLPDGARRPGAPAEALLDGIGRAVPDAAGAAFVAALRAAMLARRRATLACALADGRIVGALVEPVDGGDVICSLVDDTERRRAELTNEHMAHHDPLTGLPNRVLLRGGLERLLASPERSRDGALLLVDLDGFKPVNDAHGHPFGDALLCAVADRLRGAAGPGDVVARLGGDEFAVVRFGGGAAGPARQPDDAAGLAGRIVAALGARFAVDGVAVSIGASVGVALAGGPGCDPDRMVRDADAALYRAKAAGRATWRLHEGGTPGAGAPAPAGGLAAA